MDTPTHQLRVLTDTTCRMTSDPSDREEPVLIVTRDDCGQHNEDHFTFRGSVSVCECEVEGNVLTTPHSTHWAVSLYTGHSQ